MKTVLFVLFIMFYSGLAGAQERWTVQLNSKTLLTATAEDTSTNVVRLKELKKGSLLVTYVPGKVLNERKRRLMVYDAADGELYSREAFTLTIPVSSLKKWKLTTPFVKIYTLPVLGEAGATVRLRRVHLCTLLFE